MDVLVACEFSGVVRDAFIDAGHCAVSCDLLPTQSEKSGAAHIQADVLEVIHDKWDLVIAHPPCTHLAVSGARWFKYKEHEQEEAIKFFLKFTEANADKICIENPISIMSTKYRKPNQIVQPWMFGHGETKATCLWLHGLPNLIPTDIVSGRFPRVHRMPPSVNRSMLRSITYDGIAKAMAKQWT